MRVTGMGPRIDDDRLARLALTCVTDPADKSLTDAVETQGALEVWEALGRKDSAAARRIPGLRLDVVLAAMRRYGIRFLVPGDEEWPEQLDVLASAEWLGARGRPFGLWVAGPGHLAQWAERSVALVGARSSTRYGEMVAADLAADLTATGVTVVSGGAYGIDISAHRGALGAGGRTISVLAGGLDNLYPRGNVRVLEAVRAEGLLVSEHPPGERPNRSRFLWRNRLIAGLARGTVVVEAAARSGARNTAAWAGECQRPVMAVPGPVTSAFSEGAHELIREGKAVLVSSAAQIRELIGRMGQDTLPLVQGPERVTDRLSEAQKAVFDAVPGRGGLTTEEIAVRSGLPFLLTLTVLSELEGVGLVLATVDNRWKLRPGSVG